MSNLSSKDLTQLSELLDAENLAYRKCKSMEAWVQDSTLKQKLSGLAINHKQRFNKLFSHLNSSN